jgi:hypothetical protein
MNSERLAIQLMIAQGVLFAAETAAIHQIGSRVPLMLLAMIRAAAGLGLALILARHVGLAVLRTRQLPLQTGYIEGPPPARAFPMATPPPHALPVQEP